MPTVTDGYRGAANCQLGLCVIRSFRPEGSHLIRKARNGASSSRFGRESNSKHEQSSSLRKDGDEDGHNDCHHHHCHNRDITPRRSRIRGILGTPKAPAGARPRGATKAEQAISRKPPVGQRRPDHAREFPLQAPPGCATRPGGDIGTADSGPRRVGYCMRKASRDHGPRPVEPGSLDNPKGYRKALRSKDGISHGAGMDLSFSFVFVSRGLGPVSVNNISLSNIFFYKDPNSMDNSGVT